MCLFLQLLVSSVFAWQAAIQSTGADMCECTDSLLLAFCAPAHMDWHSAVLTVDMTFRLAEAESGVWGLLLGQL